MKRSPINTATFKVNGKLTAGQEAFREACILTGECGWFPVEGYEGVEIFLYGTTADQMKMPFTAPPIRFCGKPFAYSHRGGENGSYFVNGRSIRKEKDVDIVVLLRNAKWPDPHPGRPKFRL